VKWNLVFHIYQPANGQKFLFCSVFKRTGKTNRVMPAFLKTIYVGLFAEMPAGLKFREINGEILTVEVSRLSP